MIKTIWLQFVLLIGIGLLHIGCRPTIGNVPSEPPMESAFITVTSTPSPIVIVPTATDVPTPVPTLTPTPEPFVQQQVLGTSTGGHPIDAWVLGNGEKQLVLVGGIHGGYEWNTVLLSYELIDYFEQNQAALPENMQLIVIPVANPDGLVKVTGKAGRFDLADISAETVPGRFNQNNIDLNRNWDCEWRADATWSIHSVSGGTAPFSEVEAVILRDYLEALAPELAIFYHSAADGIYTGQCDGVQHPNTLPFSAMYADATKYALNTTFSAYTVTGDATDYLNRVGIAAFTVELTTTQSIEWEQNLAGVNLLLERISQRDNEE